MRANRRRNGEFVPQNPLPPQIAALDCIAWNLGGRRHVTVLNEYFRRYGFEGDLEKALNRVDFFRIFHTMALRYGFEHFGVLQLANEHEPSTLAGRLMLHDLPAGLAETYDKRHRLNDSALFKSFYRSTISTVWIALTSPTRMLPVSVASRLIL